QPTGKKPKTPKQAGSKKQDIANSDKRIYVRVENSQDQDLLTNIKRVVDNNIGDTEIVLVVGEPENKQAIKLPVKIVSDQTVLDELTALAGGDNVKLH